MSINVLSIVSCNGWPVTERSPADNQDEVSGEVERVIGELGDVEDQRKEQTNTLKGGFKLLSHHLHVKFEMI